LISAVTVPTGFRTIRAVSVASAVPAVLPVHEQVQQRAGKQQQVGEDTEEMCPVLGEKEERRDGEETKQRQTSRRPEPGTPF
jgi:hypothetical protein